MTLEDIRKSNKDILTAGDIAQVVKCDPHQIRKTARECPDKLGFPTIVYGSRVKIPRLAFIRFMEGKKHEGNQS